MERGATSGSVSRASVLMCLVLRGADVESQGVSLTRASGSSAVRANLPRGRLCRQLWRDQLWR